MQIFNRITGNLGEFVSVDIFPHGVEFNGHHTNAIFKINILFHGKKDKAIESFDEGDLGKLKDYINSLKWAYVPPCKENPNFLVINAIPEVEPEGDQLVFRIPTLDSDKSLFPDSFCFGSYFLRDGRQRNSFSAFFQDNEFQNSFIPAYDEVKTEEVQELASKSIHEYLKAAHDYAQKYTAKEAASGLDLGSLFSKILEEPIIAENFYGLVRTIEIPIDKFLIGEQSREFDIMFNGEKLGEKKKPFSVEKRGEKYYNGLASIFLGSQSIQNVKVDYTDPYQQELNSDVKENSSFEGFFVSGDFPDEEESPIAGFNVLMQPSGNDGTYYSLSLHEKEVSLLKPFQKKFRTFTSGVLQPHAEILLADDKVFKSQLLFVWKGENLAVNRVSDRNKETISVSFENQKEGKFLNCHFQSREKFIVGGNRSLVKKPSFLLRTVSPLGYYLPLQSEIELLKKGDSTDEIFSTCCTVEDFLENFPVEDLISGEMPAIPVQAPVVVGDKTYENSGGEFMDSQHHMVVNKITDGKDENRHIYPSPISFQNFRFKGYMKKENLRRTRERNFTLKDFIRRCEKLEERAREIPESLANRRNRVQYLADPEATKLYFTPNDLYTAAYFRGLEELQGFSFSPNYPFYKNTFSALIKASYNGNKNSIVFSRRDNPEKILFEQTLLLDGTYSFAVNHHQKSFTAKSELSELKISFVENPLPPHISNKEPEIKREIRNANYWTTILNFGCADPSSTSFKYMEETQVLELQQDNPDRLFRNSKVYLRYKNSLLKDEYPYEIFLKTEGGIGPEAGLKTQIYPNVVTIEVKIEASLSEILNMNEELLRLPLSSEDEIIFGYGNKPGETETKFYCSYDDHFLWGPDAEEINVFYRDYEFFLQWGEEELPMRGLINPEVSIRDYNIADLLRITEEVKDQNGGTSFITVEKSGKEAEEAISLLLVSSKFSKINVIKSHEHVIIAKENHPYYMKKKLGLFSSSAFQAFFPNDTSEFRIGSLGERIDIEIPNNVLPETPVFETDILVQTTLDNSWRDSGSHGIKRQKSENLVRILLDENFMKEGHNKLGIIINDIKEEKSKATAIGGDITKSLALTSNALEEFLKTENIEDNLKKYLDERDPFRRYTVNGQEYKILLCNPFFNVRLRKWQVVLSFHPFKEEENVFIKLIVAKIAKGHGDISTLPLNNSRISMFSEPQILPVYNTRQFTIERVKYRQEKAYRISNRGYSNYKRKVYAVMQSRLRKKVSIFNVKDKIEGEIHRGFEQIEVVAHGNPEDVVSKIAVLYNLDEIYIIRENRVRTIFLMEFEVHDNSNISEFLDNTPIYRLTNPLYDPEIKGIRLINIEKFEV